MGPLPSALTDTPTYQPARTNPFLNPIPHVHIHTFNNQITRANSQRTGCAATSLSVDCLIGQGLYLGAEEAKEPPAKPSPAGYSELAACAPTESSHPAPCT